MNMIWSIPAAVLIAAALVILLISRSSSNIGAAWFSAILAALFVWGWTVSLYWRVGISSETGFTAGISVPGLEGSVFVLDRISYPYMLAVSVIPVILLLVEASFTDPKTASRLWFFYLIITAIGYLSVSAETVTFIIYGWVIFDVIDLTVQYLQVRPGMIRRSFFMTVGVRFMGTLLAAVSLAHSSAQPENSGIIAPESGFFLLLACALRMGIIPISQPYAEMNRSRVGLGTMLRLVSALTVMPVLSRIPYSSLNPNTVFLLNAAGGFAALTGAVGWLLSETAPAGGSYLALGIGGMAFVCAFSGDPLTVIPWGISLGLTCGPLSLYRIHNRVMNVIAVLLVIAFSGLPYTPNAFGWTGLARAPYNLHDLLFVIVAMILIGGALIHVFRSEERKFSELEPWMRTVYPLGFFAAFGTHFFISFFCYESSFSLGVIPASAAAFVGGVLLAVFAYRIPENLRTQNVIAWGRESLSVYWRGMSRLMDMEWLMQLERVVSAVVRRTVLAVSRVLENNGGLIWELLLLAFLIAAAFSGETL